MLYSYILYTMKNNKKPRNKNSCPVTGAIETFGGKWKADILYHLNQSPRRFNELRRLIPRVTQRMLTQQLRELERDGLIHREQHLVIPPKVVYSMTDLGKSLIPVFNMLEEWGGLNMNKVENARKEYENSHRTATEKTGSRHKS